MAAPDIYVVTTAFNIPTRTVQRGDRYDREAFGLSDETDRTLRYTRHAVPLTRESYANAIASRPHGTVGRGFSIDELQDWGIIDGTEARRLRDLHDQGEVVNGYRIVAVKQGHFNRFDVRNPDGQSVRDKNFLTRAHAVAFIDTLPILGQDGAKESTDGLDVQSRAHEPA